MVLVTVSVIQPAEIAGWGQRQLPPAAGMCRPEQPWGEGARPSPQGANANPVNKLERHRGCEVKEANLLSQVFTRIFSLHFLRAKEDRAFTEDLSFFFDPAA